ncbi:endonuclease [Planomonospora sphaerica]|uniref:Endonuclease n=1 Tax=Planomonospora sphaerica TaxID=161355 RepID=A0A161LHT0_9ACTN|nr:transposase [Planomonospora sphaerica]GAT67314.1 endonuclease [Planomonospora sphaerica]
MLARRTLTVGSVAMDAGHTVIVFRRKGGRTDRLPVPPRVRALLEPLLDDRAPGEPLLVREGGGPFDRWRTTTALRRAATAGVDPAKLTPHTARATAATLALDAGVPLAGVQELLGHASPVTTQRYNRGRRKLDSHAAYRMGRRRLTRRLPFEDEAGFSMTPPHAKTWSQRGRTPVVRVRGRSRRRISIAALTCYKPGRRSRLIYRPRHDDGRRDGRKGFSWRDYRDLLIAAHQQLGGPIVLVWDNLNVHKAADLQKFTEARDWLTIYYLPPYAPGLNPVEEIWSLLRRGWLSNVASVALNTSSSASGAAYGTSSTAANS